MQRQNCNDYKTLFNKDIPLLDVRAPVEFSQGAFPLSINIPLMTDEERSAVGTCYKQQGQEKAIKLGHQLINGEIKEQRVAMWKAFCEANPNGYLYCFRGGMRSQITQQWLKEVGIDYPFVTGGYKALRRFLIDTVEHASIMPKIVLGGNTGSGKTDLIKSLKNGIDIEGAANHRGSSFGRYVTEQRTQINFENQLAIQMVKKLEQGCNRFVYEDEGRTVGCASVPNSIRDAISESNLAVIEDPFDIRLVRLLDEYVIKMQLDYIKLYGEELGWIKFSDYLNQGLFKIRKRLGLERYGDLVQAQQEAVKIMQSSGDVTHHVDWLAPLLKQYYDPMYEYQLGKKSERIIFRGCYSEVKAWLESI